jgi:hypothetical protein
MTGPGEGERDARTPEQPGWSPPWETPPTPPTADYPPDYPPVYPPPQFGAPPPGYGPPPPAGPYYPPPDYLGGGWGHGQPVPQTGTNGLAIASLITAFFGFLCCIASVVAIVLGTIALDQIKRTRQEGFGMAVAGIVLGVAGLVVALIIWIFAMRSS